MPENESPKTSKLHATKAEPNIHTIASLRVCIGCSFAIAVPYELHPKSARQLALGRVPRVCQPARMSNTSARRLVDLLAAPVVPHRFVAAQLRQPKGRFGRWVMTRMLNRGNAELITAAVDALQLQTDDSFMDLGFGGGLGLRLALSRTAAPLWGVDFSEDVVRAGRTSFSTSI